MRSEKGKVLAVPADKKAEHRRLTQVSEYSWPCLMLATATMGSVIAINTLALTGTIPLLLATGLLVIPYYWFFAVIHDGVHRSIAKNKSFNDAVGQAAILLYAPYASIHLFRWAHMAHHRFTNDEGDPDIWSHGAWWSLPFRWMTIDFYYAYRAMTSDDPAVQKVFRQSIPILVFGLAVIALLVATGYGYEYLVLWFVPTRFAFLFIGYSFFWLPHAHWPSDEHDLRQSENLTLATTLRLGNEWLFNTLFQYQNYHLVHHLWPTTPFYNNQRVYELLRPEFEARDLALVSGFQAEPTYKLVAESIAGEAS